MTKFICMFVKYIPEMIYQLYINATAMDFARPL